MRQDYPDIVALAAGREPLWFDDHGVPRYSPFHPDLVPDIYADEAVLAEIRCQACGKTFLVSLSSSSPVRYADAIRSRTLAYGDPPTATHDDCAAGPTMSSEMVRVVEYWRRYDPRFARDHLNLKAYLVWTRITALEVAFPQA